MKRKNLWMLAMLIACCIGCMFTSCSDNDDGRKPAPAPIPPAEPVDPVVCNAKVDLGDISILPAELQTVLRNRFPNLSSASDADISFCKASDVYKFGNQLEDGVTTVVAMPDNTEGMNSIISKAGGVVPKNTVLPIMFYATQKWGQHYVMLDGGVPETFNKTAEDRTAFYDRRIVPLIHWLNEVEAFKNRKRQSNTGPLADQPYDYEELTANIEDEGLSMKYNFPMSLDNSFEYLDNNYNLKASSSVDMGLRVYPLYKQSCHGEQSGDYYVVTAEITPYNQNMWAPYKTDLGVWDEMHVIGYWWHKMSTHIKLVDMDGNDIPGLDFNHTPLPENEKDSRQYSSGTSNTVGGSATAGFTGSSPTGSLGFSFSHTVNSSVSYSMDVITYNLDSSSPNREVSYMYETKGVQPEADSDIDTYWPSNCRTQWTVRQAWVWFVPNGQAGVGDNSKTKFQIVLNSRIDYQYFWWIWRAISPNEAGKTYTYTPCIVENQAWELQAPNRESWGLTSIKSEYTDVRMANIKYYLTGKEDEDPVAVDNLSYGNAECALMGLPDNKTYTIIYETKDPNTGEHKDSWKFENVAVHQGKTKDDATTALSSINATHIDE